jgi:hypothetical protein
LEGRKEHNGSVYGGSGGDSCGDEMVMETMVVNEGRKVEKEEEGKGGLREGGGGEREWREGKRAREVVRERTKSTALVLEYFSSWVCLWLLDLLLDLCSRVLGTKIVKIRYVNPKFKFKKKGFGIYRCQNKSRF